MMKIRMQTNLFHGSRMSGVLLPEWGEVVEVADHHAKTLIDRKFAVDVEGDYVRDPSAPDFNRPMRGRHEAMRETPETAALDAGEKATVKRGPGRPPKADKDK